MDGSPLRLRAIASVARREAHCEPIDSVILDARVLLWHPFRCNIHLPFTYPSIVEQPIYSPDGNFVWDGSQWIPVTQMMKPTSSVQPKIMPKSSGFLDINPPAKTQTLGMTLSSLGGNKCFGKTRVEISGINQTLESLMQLFQGGTLTPISENMLPTKTTNNSISFVKTGRMTTIHLDVFFHSNQTPENQLTVSKLHLDMYVKNKFDKKGYAFKIHGREPPQSSVRFARIEASKKMSKLETDLLEIFTSR